MPKKQFRLAMVCVALAMFVGALGQTIVFTALPRIVADVGGFDRYVWVATAYLVAATVVTPIAGGLGDLYGRKRFFIAGLIIFMAGSILLGMSRSMNEIIVFRALQGIGGGIIMTSSRVAVADLAPPELRGKYQGFLVGVFGVASIVGPVVGGLITDSYSWHGVFFLNVPIAFIVLVIIIWVFPKAETGVADRKVDYLGIILLSFALVSLLLALSLGGVRYDWDAPECLGFLSFGLVMAAVFVHVELRSKHPIIPLKIYAVRTVALATAMVFLTGFVLYGCLLMLPLFFQDVLGLSSSRSGKLLAPMLPAIAVGAVVSGQLLSRAGGHYRLHVICSTALTTVGMYLISTMGETTGVVLIETYLVLTSLGLGATLATIAVAVQNSVPKRQVGTATAGNQFWRLVGGMMGLAVAGAVMMSSFSSRLVEVISGSVAGSLPQAWLEAVRENPHALLDAGAGNQLRSGLAEADPGSALVTAGTLNLLQAVLGDALSDSFTLLALIAGLTLVTALWFRVSSDARNARKADSPR